MQASDQLMDGGMDGWLDGWQDGWADRGNKRNWWVLYRKLQDPGGLDMTEKVGVLHLPGIQPVAGRSMDKGILAHA